MLLEWWLTIAGATPPALPEWAAVPTGSTPNQDRPYIRMRDAAHTLLTNDADWDDHLDNGVAH